MHRYAEDVQVPGLFWRLVYLLTNPPALPYCLYSWPNDRNSDSRALSSTLSFRCCPHLTTIANRARIIQTHSTNIRNVQHAPPTHCGSATETTAGTEISYHLFPAGQTVLVATLLRNTGVHLQKKNTCPKIAVLSKYHRNQTFSVWGTQRSSRPPFNPLSPQPFL